MSLFLRFFIFSRNSLCVTCLLDWLEFSHKKLRTDFFGCIKITNKKISSKKFGPDQDTKNEKGIPKGGIWEKNEIANFSFLRGLYARRIALATTTIATY